MGKKGGLKHLKRYKAPGYWPISKKAFVWAPRPSPGPHPIANCIPLLLLIRDVLGYAHTSREAKLIISRGAVRVDGRVRRDEGYPVGLMDVVEIPEANIRLRMVPAPKEVLAPVEIDESEASFKLCKVINKTTLKGGNVQLNLHDGRNVVLRISDPKNPIEDGYSSRDVIKLSIPDQSILDHFKFEIGSLAIVIDGKNIGARGRIASIEPGTALRPAIASLECEGGAIVRTLADYVFVVGREAPAIKLYGD
ncbi:MAG: 30S ribosomal protein S4e [Candidatus Bathyarchaeia archaeon]